MRHSEAQPLPHHCFIAPQHRSRHVRGSDELCEGFEHLSHESFARPISHSDGPSGTTHSQHLAGHELWPRGKHRSDQTNYDVEAAVFKRELFGIAFHETSVEAFRL